jgi:hypothetical protein
MADTVYHVCKKDGAWQLKRGDAGRVSGTYSSKAAALKKAEKLLVRNSSQLVVHGADGRIRHIATGESAARIRSNLLRAYKV